MTEQTERTSTRVSRRNIVVGTAWAVPAVMTVGAAPAMAASTTAFSFTSISPTVINANNSTATIAVGGAGPDGKTVTVTVGSYTGTATVVSGAWSHTIPAASLPEGSNVVVTATYSGTPFTKTYTKDVTAPFLSVGNKTTASNTKSGTVGVTPGTAPTPTPDAIVTYSNLKLTPTGGGPALTTLSGTWNTAHTLFTWTWTPSGNPPAGTVSVDISQTDGAQNITSHTVTWRI